MWMHLLSAWYSGYRSRSFQALFIISLLSMGGTILAATFSGRQPSTVAMDVGLSSMRFVSVLMTLFWCQELIGKEIERKTVFFALTYPIGRSAYIIGRYLGILLLTLVATMLLGVMLLITIKLATPQGYQQSTPIDLTQLPLVLAFNFLDLAVVAAFSTLIASISTTPMLPLAMGAAFSIAARSLGPTIEFLRRKGDMAADIAPIFDPILSATLWIMPDLSRMDIRVAALYSQNLDSLSMLLSAAMCFAYIIIMMALATWQFNRREFI
ncbi:ABC transporter permease [Parachitinimonas caeni]|uniref:ABC transporter permease n=1 Tax=Parachitinimonas caeni TaxID=3031301 RepID=A0ABT7DX50_9NEIS|nr:ABC transporter permease [Parachitinimonas caeni]MDK2123222.1 ABC transporter permease [Parachitinimonas caeni]